MLSSKRVSFSVIFAALIAANACATISPPKSNAGSQRRASTIVDCLDTLHASDSITTIVKISVAAQDSTVKLPRGFEAIFVDDFRSHFRIPGKLPLSVVTGWEPCDSIGSRCIGGVLNLGAVVYVTAYRDGTLSDATIIDETMTPTLAAGLNLALVGMSRAKQVLPPGEADSIGLTIRVAPDERADTVESGRHLFKAVVPRYSAPFSYATMPQAGIQPRYPLNARLAGIEDSVTLAFTVGSDGTIAAESIDLVRANYREFVASVFDALLRARYHPAHLGDCAVATRIKQRFVFRAPQ
jgi:TonB family protein